MQFKLRHIPAAAATVVLAACGGGNGGVPSTPTPTPTSGVAVDGYLQSSKVVCDTNGNGVADAGEIFVFTLADGTFRFADGCKSGVIVSGGKNADTGLMFVGVLKAPAGATVASPLTTLMAAGMSQSQINTALGLPANTDLLNTDPAASTGGKLNNPDLLKKTLAVQQLMQKVAEMSGGLAGDSSSATLMPIYADVAVSFANSLKNGVKLNSEDGTLDSAMVNTMVKSAISSVMTSSAVPAAVKTALTNAGGASVLADVTSTSLKVQADAILKATEATLTAVTKDRQGNESISESVKKAVDDGKLNANTSTADAAKLSKETETTAAAPTPSPTPPPAPTPPPTPTPSPTTTLATFDETVAPAITAFGGTVISLDAGPTGGSGKALKISRNGGEPWAGTWVAVPAIQSTAGAVTVSARVYSPTAGIKMVAKAEYAENTGSGDTQATTTVVQGWQTLSWNFTNLDSSKVYNRFVLIPNLGNVDTDKTYYLDDISASGSSQGGGTPTPAPTPTPTDYLYLADNAISLFNGTTTASYSMSAFQSAGGISVKWPMADNAALKLNLAEVGNFTLAPGQKLTAAMQITETKAGGKGEIKGYIDNVSVTKSGKNVMLVVPNVASADAKMYGVSSDGNVKAVINFSNAVAGITNTLSAAAAMVNSITLGNVVNYAVNNVSNDFNGMNALRGKYKVTIVVTELPLRQVDGTKFTPITIEVPTKMTGGQPSDIKPVTGWGLEGYITLTD
jgi:hypothetical protein